MAETFTVNYNWTKPEVGASVDNWGGYINADLDGIDTTVKAVSTVANAAQTAGQVTAALANYLPLAGGTLTGTLNATSISTSGNISVNSPTPTYSFRASGAQPVDQKNWDFFADSAGNLSVRSLNDAYSAASTPLQFVRGTGYLSPTIKANADVTFGAGVAFGSNLAASTTDVSKHIALYGTSGYGFNITSGRMNIVAGGLYFVNSAGDDTTFWSGAGGVAQYKYSSDNSPASLTFQKSRGGSQAAIAAVVQSDFLGQFSFNGYSGSGYVNTANIRGQITEPTPSATAMGSQMDMLVTPLGTTTTRQAFVFKYGELQVLANAANAAPAWLSLSKSGSGQENSIRGYTTGTAAANLRWRMQLGNTAAETGSNTGSDFSLAGYSDTGAAINTPLTITRATGLGVVAGDPTAPLGIATKQYVDGFTATPNDNRIINGDMRIDQRNNGAAITPTVNPTYTIDRWVYGFTQPSKFTFTRLGPITVSTAVGFPYILQALSQSAYTPLAGDTFYISQKIEADMVSDFLFGTANAQPVTVSFWANVAVAGTYSGVLTNLNGVGAADRAYPFTFTHAASGWQKFAITIPGDTGGTWVMAGNACGVMLRFDLGSGATFRAPAGAWASGNFVGANGAANVCATNGTAFQLTGVKLEVGSVATPFNRQSLAKSLADCQRYYMVNANCILASYNAAGQPVYGNVYYPTSMRAQPTVAITGVTATNASGLATSSIAGLSTTFTMNITAVGQGTATFTAAFTAEL